MGKYVRSLLCLALAALGGCAGAPPPTTLPTGAAAYQRVPSSTGTETVDASPVVPRDYVIGAQDKLAITVFGERDLSTDQAQIDASGSLFLPLVGKIAVTGKTADQLSAELTRRWSKYIVDPHVSIIVLNTVSQKVTVEGSVNQAGVYGIAGRTTLLEIMAMAHGASNVAETRRVAVFRIIDGRRMGAMFDASQIEAGQMPDPEVQGGDVVIVGHSARRQAWRDFLATAPVLGFFIPLATVL